jgi:hypothetical protein
VRQFVMSARPPGKTSADTRMLVSKTTFIGEGSVPGPARKGCPSRGPGGSSSLAGYAMGHLSSRRCELIIPDDRGEGRRVRDGPKRSEGVNA